MLKVNVSDLTGPYVEYCQICQCCQVYQSGLGDSGVLESGTPIKVKFPQVRQFAEMY